MILLFLKALIYWTQSSIGKGIQAFGYNSVIAI